MHIHWHTQINICAYTYVFYSFLLLCRLCSVHLLHLLPDIPVHPFRDHDKLSRKSDEQNELFKQHQTDDMQLEENLKLAKTKMKKLKASLKTDREKVRAVL